MRTTFGGNNGHGEPRSGARAIAHMRGYVRIDVDEKATGMLRWVLGFIALRELLVAEFRL